MDRRWKPRVLPESPHPATLVPMKRTPAILPATLACALLLASPGCALFRSSKPKEANPSDLPLTPVRTSHRYVMPSDLQPRQLRVALIDVDLRKETTRTSLTVGMLQPHEGLLTLETPTRTCTTIQQLVQTLDPYLDRMPVGLVLTEGGRVPGAQGEPPAAFGAFVSQLQEALDKEKILFAFILPKELHLVR